MAPGGGRQSEREIAACHIRLFRDPGSSSRSNSWSLRVLLCCSSSSGSGGRVPVIPEHSTWSCDLSAPKEEQDAFPGEDYSESSLLETPVLPSPS